MQWEKKTNPAFLENNAELLSKSWAKSIRWAMSSIGEKLQPKLILITLKIYGNRSWSKFKVQDIPLDLIFNWDQIGSHYVPVPNWPIEKEGLKVLKLKGLMTRGRSQLCVEVHLQVNFSIYCLYTKVV